MKRTISTEAAPAAIGPYSQAVLADNTLYTSGQLGIDPATGKLREGVGDQAVQAMENLKAVLAAADMTFQNAVKTTIFVANMGDFAQINEIYARYFTADKPARSTVQVAALPLGGLVEIECIAIK